MPAKSKDQQRAAGIALQAKKNGTVGDLPSGAAKNMAKSMSVKELEKFASTKHKGLPENKPNEHTIWAGESLVEVFAEEMLGTDEKGEAITSDKPTSDQIEDAGRDKEDDTGGDAYDNSWDSEVHADAPMAQSGRAMGSNSMGAARVSFESAKSGDPNSLDILFEHESEFSSAWEDGPHPYEHEHDYDNLRRIAQGEVDQEVISQFEQSIKKMAVENIQFDKKQGKEIDRDWVNSIVWDEINDWFRDNGGEFSKKADMIWNNYGDLVPADTADNVWDMRVKNAIAEHLGGELWEELMGEDSDSEDLDEQVLGAAAPGVYDWGPGIDSGAPYDMYAEDPLESELDTRLHNSLIDDMVDHVITHNDLYGKSPDEWLPENLLADFEYDYSVSPNNPDDIEAAQTAIQRAKEEIAAPEEVRFESKRWQKLAGMKILKEVSMDPKRQRWAENYIKKMVGHKWSWDDIAEKLQDSYGIGAFDIDKSLKPYWSSLTRVN